MKRLIDGRGLLAAAAIMITATDASAQGLGGGRLGGATNQAQVQAQVQQRAQAQVQERIQSRLQQQAQGQIQARAASAVQSRVHGRIQADTARAIGIAKRLGAGRDAVSAGANANASTNISASTRGGTANRTARSDANARLGMEAGVSAQPLVTAEEVQVYDEIFGQFNPLRKGRSGEAASGGTANSSVPPSERGAQRGMSADKRPAFATLIVLAAQERRAEIAALRDRAVAAGDTSLLTRADEMELRLDAFVEANATQSVAAGSSDAESSNASGAGSRTARRPKSGF